MTQWVSANLASLLPSEVSTILSTIKTLTSVVSTPLQAVSTILSTAKALIVSLPVLDLTAALKTLIESFKDNVLGTGFYLCEMWDYPVRQITQTSDHGPNNTYGNDLNYDGGEFNKTFLYDLLASFEDMADPNRPKFTTKSAMLVLVAAAGTIDALDLSTEDGNIGQAFRGLEQSISNAARGLNEQRWKGAWNKIRQVAEKQPSNKVASRIDRMQNVFKLFSYLPRAELDVIPIPFSSEYGSSFFEFVDVEDIDWETDIVPILETIEIQYEISEYPDWSKATLKEVYPELANIVDAIFDPILDLLVSGATIKDKIIALITAIQNKLNELQRIIDYIDKIIEDLDNILKTTGLHAIFVTSSTGVSGIKTKMLAATNSPFASKGFFSGIAILVGGGPADVSAFEAVFSGVGL